MKSISIVVMSLVLVGLVSYGFLERKDRIVRGEVVEVLKGYGFGGVQVLEFHPTTVCTKRARLSGIKFDVTAVKDGTIEVVRIAVFYRPVNGDMMFFRPDGSRLILD